MECRLSNEEVERIETAIPVNGVAVLLYEWATNTKLINGNIDTALAKIVGYHKFQPFDRKASNGFIDTLLKYGLVEKIQIKKDNKVVDSYRALYPQLVEYIVENKRNKLGVDYELAN